MSDESGEDELRGLPPAAVERVRHQRESGVRGLAADGRGGGRRPQHRARTRRRGVRLRRRHARLDRRRLRVRLRLEPDARAAGRLDGLRPAASRARSAAASPGGTSSGRRAAPAGWQPGWQAGYFGAGVGGGWRTPVVVSGDMTAAGSPGPVPTPRPSPAPGRTHTAGCSRRRARSARTASSASPGAPRGSAGGGHEYASLGTAVRFVDPALPASSGRRTPWAATLTARGLRGRGVGRVPARRRRDRLLPRAQARGLAAQAAAVGVEQHRGRRAHGAAVGGPGRRPPLADPAGAASWLGRWRARRHRELALDRGAPCGEEKDMTAEALFVGTVLVAAPRAARPPRRAPSPCCRSLRPPPRQEEEPMTQPPEAPDLSKVHLPPDAETPAAADALGRGHPAVHVRPVGQRVPARPRGGVPARRASCSVRASTTSASRWPGGAGTWRWTG